MFLTTVHSAYDVLAQVGNPTPEAPPEADSMLKLVRFLVWSAIVVGALAFVGGIVALIVWTVRQTSRPAPQRPQEPYGPR
ncbi:hypothetical protein NS506_05561 [Nocardia seriolae]|uniref:Uncharacterized protein n=2 Tax=Nocardia seriolae TaxID=37332 RepID=A0ABC9YYE7_9NOCA|nr:hypothetical protein NS506_05561 [Nocardia seriolae]GEM25473.1 hypothetical protein NS2_37120 [Nocardia seriolae NBRC 15557]PSK29331.1 hypothetical protein C6575_21625 [Nocardia seriolae]RLP30306.1 hypothetical protein D6158_19205 [Nocardia seriolae]BEK89181.1 hypothetical protein NSERKGN1266_51320 [Nocardia seriolae]